MAGGIYKALNIEDNERTSVLLLLTQSIFIGIFFGAFEIGATTLFLDEFDEGMIANAFAVSGFVGIILTSIYTKLQSVITFKRLAVLNLITVAILTGVLRFGFEVFPIRWLIFAIFVMMGPLNIIALLGFWGTVGRLFTLRQGKRLFGLIDTGGIFGIILSSYAIPVILAFRFETKDLLIISAVSVLIALIFQFVIGGKFALDSASESGDQKSRKKPSFMSLFKDRYVTMMAVFVTLSMVMLFFVSYSFLSVTNEQYPDPREMASFLGLFMGTLMIFTLLIKTFIFSWLMKTYGLKISLAISAFLMVLFTIIASLVGTFFGYTSVSENFMLFFMIIALSRLFSKTLKDSIEVPSFKILYQSLDERIRYDVQARVDGTINEFAALMSGLILAGLGALSFFNLIHFSYVLVGFLIIWVFVSLRLYKEYRGSLQKALSSFKTPKEGSIQSGVDYSNYLESTFEQKKPGAMIQGMKVIKEINPYLYDELLPQALHHKSDKGRDYIFNWLREANDGNMWLKVDEIVSEYKIKLDKDLQNEISGSAKGFFKNVSSFEQIDQLLHSKVPEDRIKGAKHLRSIPEGPQTAILVALLRDFEPRVKIEAIKLIEEYKKVELAPALVDLLSSDLYVNHTYHTLISLGEDALDSLDLYFYKTGIEVQTLIRIVRIFGKIRGEKAIQYLLTKLGYPKREVILETIRSLRFCSYKSTEEDLVRLNQVIENVIETTAWNLTASASIIEEEVGLDLKEAIQEELTSNFDLIFELLSLSYEPRSIFQIRENLESGTSEGVNFALELLDLVVAEELKPRLFPLLDDITLDEKIKLLQNFFPLQKMESRELLYAIVNRDYNKINNWTKACALKAFWKVNLKEIKDDLTAQLFNPDPLLRGVAARLIHKTDPEKYAEILLRLPEEIRDELRKIIERDTDEHHLLFSKIQYFRKSAEFKKIPGLELYYLAHRFELVSYQAESEIPIDEVISRDLYFWIIKGSLGIRAEDGTIQQLGDKDVLCNFSDNDFDLSRCTINAMEDTLCYKLEGRNLGLLLFDYPDIAQVFLELTTIQV